MRASPDSPSARLAELDRERARAQTPERLAEQYRKLIDRLQPETPEGVRRLDYMLAHGSTDVVEIEEPLVRAAETCPDVDVADRCRLAAAAAALQRRDAETARRRFTDLLARRRGSGDRIESRALINLALIGQSDERRHEAFVLAGHALPICERNGDVAGIVVCELVRGGALLEFEDLESAETALQRVTDLLDRLDEADRSRFRGALEGLRVQRLQQLGREEDAVEGVRRLQQLEPGNPWWVGYEADLLLGIGRPAEALAGLERVRVPFLERPTSAIRWHEMRARAAHALRDDATFGTEAALALQLAEDAATEFGAHHFWVQNLLRAFEERGDEAAVRRAIEIGATEYLLRIVSATREAAEIEELRRIDPADGAVLQRAVERLRERHAAFLARLAEMLGQLLERGDASVGALFSEEGQVRVCAWCGRLRTAEGLWVHLAHLVVEDDPFSVTHGICSDCASTLR